MKQAWWKESVVYQVYSCSFQDSNGDGIGDLAGVTSRPGLPARAGRGRHLALALLSLPRRGQRLRYITTTRPSRPCFGTMEDFDRMLAEAHARGHSRGCGPRREPHLGDAPLVHRAALPRQPEARLLHLARRQNGGPPNNWGSKFSAAPGPMTRPRGNTTSTPSAPPARLNWDNPPYARRSSR